MILLDRNNQEAEVISQYLLPNHTDTVYNIEVDDFHTYHVGRLGVWVHNADCCAVSQTSDFNVTSSDIDKVRQLLNLSNRDTVGVAKTDIPGLEGVNIVMVMVRLLEGNLLMERKDGDLIMMKKKACI